MMALQEDGSFRLTDSNLNPNSKFNSQEMLQQDCSAEWRLRQHGETRPEMLAGGPPQSL